MGFFLVNIWILGVIISDVAKQATSSSTDKSAGLKEKEKGTGSKVEVEASTAKSRSASAGASVGGGKGTGKEKAKTTKKQDEDRYRNVLESYMNDLNTAGVAGREQVQGMVLGEVSDSDSE